MMLNTNPDVRSSIDEIIATPLIQQYIGRLLESEAYQVELSDKTPDEIIAFKSKIYVP